VQGDHRARHVGRRPHELGELPARERVLLEQRVAEHLGEVAHQPPVLVGGEGAQVDVERAREAQQQLRGERPAVVLDEVEVARRHAEPLRERGLRQPGARAHGAHAGAVARGRRGGEARAPVARGRRAAVGRAVPGAVGRAVGCRARRARVHPRNASDGRSSDGRSGVGSMGTSAAAARAWARTVAAGAATPAGNLQP
jgi:hypothetical protein